MDERTTDLQTRSLPNMMLKYDAQVACTNNSINTFLHSKKAKTRIHALSASIFSKGGGGAPAHSSLCASVAYWPVLPVFSVKI